MTDQPDYGSLGFALTTGDVAEVLSLTLAETLDLVRAHQMTVLVVPSGGIGGLEFRYHPDEVSAFAHRKVTEQLPADATVHALVQAALRRYLAEVSPVADYDDALHMNAPLLGATRTGEALHVRVDGLLEHHRGHSTSGMPLTISGIENTLSHLGALRVRGVVPANDRGGKQRWATWWRIPLSLLHGDDESSTAADLVGGVREPGEEIRRRGAGSPYLAKPLGVS